MDQQVVEQPVNHLIDLRSLHPSQPPPAAAHEQILRPPLQPVLPSLDDLLGHQLDQALGVAELTGARKQGRHSMSVWTISTLSASGGV